ncbi:hypothetical protein [Chitinophaga sp. OAE865]|uniref:hypothetical protein n=1 Tax=Chitinophaga sp. OAE865 TaxID=2817898 RepID=UPI001AE1E9F2
MKKFLFVVAAGFIGLATAVAGNYRATFEYVNLSDNGTYTRQVVFDDGDCQTAATKPCHYTYTASTPLASPISEAALIAAGAVPSTNKTLYIP